MQLKPMANLYFKKVGKTRPDDVMESSNYEKIFQTCDGGYRWGIMTTNGSESLNNVFRMSRRLPVSAIVEDTFYKCNKWFLDRRTRAMALVDVNQQWSDRVEKKLKKRWTKASKMNVVSFVHGEGQYQVSSPNEYVPVIRRPDGSMSSIRKEFQYIVTRTPGNKMECTCRGIQLTGIPCVHVLAVCRERNWNENQFIADQYNVNYLLSTWNGVFIPFGNPAEWPQCDNPRVLPSRSWIRVGRRKHTRHVITMDEMQGKRPKGHRARRSTTDSIRRGM
jgi:hypothetical protein